MVVEPEIKTYKDRELVYSATSRCPCGAGLAYPKNAGVGTPSEQAWDCADILTGRAIPKGGPGWKTHTDRLPFAFYEVKSEDQPSARGATTRPPDAERPPQPRPRIQPKVHDHNPNLMQCGHHISNWIRLPEESALADFCERCNIDRSGKLMLARVQQLEQAMMDAGLSIPDYPEIH